jgi:tetratricopeptide (TPR) repeat protein/HEAT repeat protein
MRSTAVCLVILIVLSVCGVAGADDWSVRRSPFDPRIVARYKALLNRRPNDGYALRKLVSLYRKHRSLKALVNEYRRLAKAKPRSFAFQVILGHLHRRSGNNQEAVRHYERAAKLNPKSPTVPAALAALYRKLGRTKDAEKAYDKALSLATSKRGKKRYLRALATLALANGDLAGARKHFDRLVALEPKNILVRIELAQAMAKSGHRTEAIAEYRRILKITSDSARKADVLKEIGALLEQEGKEDKAVATFRRAMSLTARGHWLRRELTERIISIYRKREDLKALIEHYERTWTRKGHFEHEVLGRLYDETGDETKALKSYRAALKKARHAVDTRVRLIALLERTGQDREVINEYRKLARIAPGEPRYQLELAKRLYRAGKQKEAFQILDQCGRRFPGDASVHSALADLYARWGEQKRAMRAAQVLVRIEPRDPSHLVNLGEQYYLQGNKRKALETWRRLLQVVRKRHAALAKLAEVLDQHDMTREAITLYLRAIKLKPKHLPYRRSLALLLERKRKTVKALEAWDEVLKLAKVGKLQAARREARAHIIDILHRSYQLRSKTRTYRMDFEGAGNIDAGFMLAEALVKLGSQERAAEVYRRILELDRDNLEAMTALEAVYRRQRKLSRAVTLLKRMAKLQPRLAKDYFQRIADLLRQLYKDKQALVYAHKAVALGTKDARSYQRLGELHEKMEDYAAAMTAYRKAIQLAPNRFQVHFALARLHTQQGQYKMAEKLFRRVIRSAKAPEVIRKAFRLGVELADYLGELKRMEKEILPLSVMSTNAEVYRRLLVRIYRRRVPMLINQVRQGNAATRQTAREELQRIGIRGLAPLLEELATSSTGRGELVRMLGYLGNPNAVIPLLRIAKREPDEEVLTIRGSGYHPYQYGGYRGSRLARLVNRRVEAIVAVGRIADKRAVDGLVQLRSNREGAIRDAAAWALSRIKSRASSKALYAALGDQRVTVQIMACAGLGVTGGATVRPVLEEVMLDNARDERVRAACAWGLGVIGGNNAAGAGASVPPLTSMLQSGDILLQRCAAWSLGMIGDNRPLSALVRALWSKRRDVRRVVLWAIAQVSAGAAASAPPTRTPDVVVKDGKLQADPFVAELTGGVETLRGRKLARSLARVVETQREALTTGLRQALMRHRDVVLRVLGDLDAEPTRLSLGMLSAGRSLLGAPERARLDRGVDRVCRSVKTELVRFTDHRDALVRARALSVYSKLAPSGAEAQIRKGLSDPDWNVRLVALRGTRTAFLRGGLGRRAVVRMVGSALRARHWHVRETAAEVAGQLAQPTLTPLLVQATRDPNGFVRQAAVTALGSTGGPAAGSGLHRTLSDDVPHVRAAACRALGRLRVPGARAWVAPLTRDPSPQVRRAAKMALSTLR